MKTLKVLTTVCALVSPAAFASDVETAYLRFDDLRASDASASDKALGAFEYFSVIIRVGAEPTSYEGCLNSIKLGFSSGDPCMPVSSRIVDGGAGGGTGGID